VLRDRDGTLPPVGWSLEEINGQAGVVDQRPGAAGISP
jgi:hypothetical protein